MVGQTSNLQYYQGQLKAIQLLAKLYDIQPDKLSTYIFGITFANCYHLRRRILNGHQNKVWFGSVTFVLKQEGEAVFWVSQILWDTISSDNEETIEITKGSIVAMKANTICKVNIDGITTS